MISAKIRIKVGSMELEYEGDPAFLTGGIEALLTTMGDLAGRIPNEPAQAAGIAIANSPPSELAGFHFSTNTIAAHLDAKTGPELVICAMAQLELVQGKSSSSRSEILAEMKSATTYFNTNIASNLSKSLSNLTKAKRINQVGAGSYSLSASEKKKVEVKVAEID
ncbi:MULTISPECIES: hypothetical protein [Rhizobium]|uniref:Uncharacterized protein n=1 Tax=Rhizobium paranaense TaxID=1650438 RepID=A0A7W8XTD6_9HYPH|nr:MULTISPECIES: hypothetical protein [Rhizobium]MBB5575247.1 hypothetical protein [Rhizobium paranaense]PST64338.1 hypothetical protein C9E91_02280 [Rhizobium sp. SEMIA4064]